MTASPHKQLRNSSSQKISARRLAYSILFKVETENAYASELLHSRLETSIDERDAALATELAMGTLRWKRLLDFFAERYTQRAISALDPEVLIVLRLGIYQLRHLTRMPPRAAVNETVELVKQVRRKSAAALVNAALRNAAQERELPVSRFLPAEMEAVDTLALAHSHPTWLVERWLRNFGERETIALIESNNRVPEQAGAFVDTSRRNEAIESLLDEGVSFGSGRLLRDAVLVQGGSIGKTRALRNGWIGIQDEASQLVPLLLGARHGNTVLDLCAAPGGKTMILASRVGKEGRVVAADFREARLRNMRARFATMETQNVSFVLLDGTRDLPFAGQFDRILVDAPCSGTGTLARNPEIRWRLKAEDLADLHQRQVKLLRSAVAQLSAKGALLYSTCSLEPEENEGAIKELLGSDSRLRSETVTIPEGDLANGVNEESLICEDGAFRTFPPRHGTDGFFAALVRRK